MARAVFSSLHWMEVAAGSPCIPCCSSRSAAFAATPTYHSFGAPPTAFMKFSRCETPSAVFSDGMVASGGLGAGFPHVL
jgi:hypothetical protein